MSEVFDVVDSEYTEVAEPEHFDMVLQGTLDTLEGMESLRTTYTKAQEYLYSCLNTSESLSYQQRVDGMESVFSNIGEGLGTAWEYIKKLFKTVWEYFFGSGDNTVEAKAEKTEKVIEKNEKQLKTLAGSGKTEAQVEGIRKKVKEKAKKIQADPQASSSDKAVATDVIKKIDEGNVKSTSQKEMDIGAMCERLAKIDKKSRQALIKRIGETENLRKSYAGYVEKDRSDDIGNGRFKSMYKVFRETLKQGTFTTKIPDLIKVDSITTILNAATTQDKLLKAVEDHGKFAKFIASEKTEFQTEIKALEEALAKKGKGSGQGEVNGEAYKNKGEVSARLKAANAALSIVNATAGYQTKMLDSLEKLSDSVKDIFGDYSNVIAVV
jgi:hypothetical protein